MEQKKLLEPNKEQSPRLHTFMSKAIFKSNQNLANNFNQFPMKTSKENIFLKFQIYSKELSK